MNRLKKARFQRNLTQIKLWQKTGVQPFRISYIENGYVEARPDEKKKLSDALGYSDKWIFPGDEEETDV